MLLAAGLSCTRLAKPTEAAAGFEEGSEMGGNGVYVRGAARYGGGEGGNAEEEEGASDRGIEEAWHRGGL